MSTRRPGLKMSLEPCDTDSRGTSPKLQPSLRGSAAATNIHTTKNGDSHLEHSLSLMLTVSLLLSNVLSPCKLFFIIIIICF